MTAPNEPLVPVPGCWVRRRDGADGFGRVIDSRLHQGRAEVAVDWMGSRREWLPVGALRAGFQPGWAAQDVPYTATRRSLGLGRIVGARELGGREQMLIQLDADGRSVWVPYENLRRVKDARMRYERAETGRDDHAERFRLKLLANALENWNNLTGSLDRLDVDPLPHQIQLVHRIVSSGNFNWLIADDVGLGKTIEVGLLLAALKRRGRARRVLVVAPAGLTRQWQDELQFKFDQQYEIYGRDFAINRPEHWKLHDHVIVSIDLAKRDEHIHALRQAGEWDVVVFDEAHKLTRHASGERAQRYRLAEALRSLSESFILLSGTPHQGYADRFVALLELVRPDMEEQLHTLHNNPEVVADLILRNRKSEVTDADGNFIFKGHRVHRVPVEPSGATHRFQDRLRTYLSQGYNIGATSGAEGRAIGFVMTTYRKLASSSIAAITRALELRRLRLHGVSTEGAVGAQQPLSMTDLLENLEEGGDEQDDLAAATAETPPKEFFAHEIELIDELLVEAARAGEEDEKLRIFLDEVARILVEDSRKLLVFTEYRATQTYLQEALQQRFPQSGAVLLINGSMKLEEKLEAIQEFNEGACQFLISTEAGGEGLNLHHSCHVMVNYDLPWNPARLVQRIGRLYRYGQQEVVVVVNLHARDSFDNAAIDLMLGRVDQIVRDMAPVGEEYNDRLHAEILGDVLEQLDFGAVLKDAVSMDLNRTRQQIDDALDRAQRARDMQDEIFRHVAGYDPTALEGTLGFTMQHVDAFIRAMMPFIGATIDREQYDGAVLDLRLPEDLRGAFPEFLNRTVVRVTTDRRLAMRLHDVVLLDFETGFFQHLVNLAKSLEFDGVYASIGAPQGADGALAAFRLRWQNDQGEPLTEKFLTVFRRADGQTMVNPPFLAQMLVSRASAAPVPNATPKERQPHFQTLAAEASRLLGRESTRFKHPNGLVELAAADCADVANSNE